MWRSRTYLEEEVVILLKRTSFLYHTAAETVLIGQFQNCDEVVCEPIFRLIVYKDTLWTLNTPRFYHTLSLFYHYSCHPWKHDITQRKKPDPFRFNQEMTDSRIYFFVILFPFEFHQGHTQSQELSKRIMSRHKIPTHPDQTTSNGSNLIVTTQMLHCDWMDSQMEVV